MRAGRRGSATQSAAACMTSACMTSAASTSAARSAPSVRATRGQRGARDEQRGGDNNQLG
jgi:hypothetical protein